jgi:hypothetical protein
MDPGRGNEWMVMTGRPVVPFLAPVLLALALTGLAAAVAEAESPDPAADPDAESEISDVAALIEKAEAARLRAVALRAEWLETEDLIGQARQQASSGHMQTAVGLADLARRQAELAVEQALREAEAWRDRVVR